MPAASAVSTCEQAAPAAIPVAQPTPAASPPATNIAVPKAVALLNGTFGMRELKEVLAREHLGGHPDTEIRRVLNRMVKSGGLRVVSAARGRGGSTCDRVANG
jgi:hypothetical protein